MQGILDTATDFDALIDCEAEPTFRKKRLPAILSAIGLHPILQFFTFFVMSCIAQSGWCAEPMMAFGGARHS
ncbi:MAG TPA: hypothetical protein DCP92_14655 [Nitrospiraceae bacterium]|nr:hypothetical protein [Nitrospiraceae bacterium]